ncbi:MAG: tetratricopeptide repeat protein [Planctomycetota bacterium]|nr:tetratricopeptide repeat protein [Planctomycetota bacterium]
MLLKAGMACLGVLALCGPLAATEDRVEAPSPNPFQPRVLEREGKGAYMRHPLHKMRVAWDRYFRVFPGTREDHQHTTLKDILAEPRFFLDRKVEFDVYWNERGAFFRQFVSPFHRDSHVNFNCWPYESELWNRDTRADIYPFVYVDRREEKLIQKLEKLPQFAPIRVWARVEIVSEGYPWMSVHDFEPIKEPVHSLAIMRELELAWLRMEKKDWTVALNTFQQALRWDLPINTARRVWEAVGICHTELYHYASAREAFLNSLELYGGPRIQLVDALNGENRANRALVRLAQADLRLGLAEEAKQAAELVIRNESSNALAHVELGLALAHLGDYRQGYWEVDAGQRLSPGGRLPEAFRNRAQIHLLRQEFEAAMTELESAVIHRPNDVRFHMELGEVYLKLEKADKAQIEFENSTRLAPDRPEPFHKLGLTLKTLGDLAAKDGKKDDAGALYLRALEMYEKAHQVDETYTPAYADHAELLRLLGKEEDAKKLLEKASSAIPGNAEMLETLFTEARKLGDWIAMEKAAMQAVLLDPRDSKLHERVAMVRESKPEADLDGAKEEYEVAVKLDPENAEAWSRLAYVDRRLGNWAGGAEAAAKAATLDENNAGAWADLAVCRRNLGDLGGSMLAAEKAFVLGDNVSSRLNLAIAYLDLGKPEHKEQALKLAKAAAADAAGEAEQANANSVLGAALHANGQHAEAREAFAQADALLKDDPWHNLWLARCYHASGHLAEARDRYQSALRQATLNGGEAKVLLIVAADAEKEGRKVEKAIADGASSTPAPAAVAQKEEAPEKPVETAAKPEEQREQKEPKTEEPTSKNAPPVIRLTPSAEPTSQTEPSGSPSAR